MLMIKRKKFNIYSWVNLLFIKLFSIFLLLMSLAFAQTITLRDGGILYTLEIDGVKSSKEPLKPQNTNSPENPQDIYNYKQAQQYASSAFYIPAGLNFSSLSVSVKSEGNFTLKDFSPASKFFSSANVNSNYQYPIPANYTNTTQALNTNQNAKMDSKKALLSAYAGLGYQFGNGFRLEIFANTGSSIDSKSVSNASTGIVSLATSELDILDKTSSNAVVGKIKQSDEYSISSSMNYSYKSSLGLSMMGYYDFATFSPISLIFTPYVGAGLAYSRGSLSMNRNIQVTDKFNGTLTGVNVGYPDYTYSATSVAEYNAWGSDMNLDIISPMITIGTLFSTTELKKLNIILDFSMKIKLNSSSNKNYKLPSSVAASSYSISNPTSKCLTYCNGYVSIDTPAISTTEPSDYHNIIADNNSVKIQFPTSEVILSLGFRYYF